MIVRRRPKAEQLIDAALEGQRRPPAVVLAGHNGSGKSTLWYERLAPRLQLPLINADRLLMSILPERDNTGKLAPWAQQFRDGNARWALVAQEGVSAFRNLVMKQSMPFAFETVFSYWQLQNDGTYASKADDIIAMQTAGYFVVLLFVGLASPQLSVARVETRKLKGGHDVPLKSLMQRFPRTQVAVGHASSIADMTLMFDNSRDLGNAFSLVRAQRKKRVLFDVRDIEYRISADLRTASAPWLEKVCGPWVQRSIARRQGA